MDTKELTERLLILDEKIKDLESAISSDLKNLKYENGLTVDLPKGNNEILDSDQYDMNTYNELRNTYADKDYERRIQRIIEDLPTSNGSNYYKKFEVNIGIIADEFLYHSYESTANFFYVTKDNYKTIEANVDFLLVVSAWKGLSNEWEGLGNPKRVQIRKELSNIIEYFRLKNKKTIFYSKEDPTNYEYFVDIAKQCDYIFTTAIEKIPQYKIDCNNDNVHLLEFGVNPIFNNPIGINLKKDKDNVLFAGSWYKKYPKRQKDTRMLFDGVLNSGKELKVLDRNFYRDSKSFLFPVKYLKYISPAIDHSTLQSLSKINRWCINLNSIQFSQTMFASRVFELQCMGNLILSNYSAGVNNLFPNVFTVFSENEVKGIIKTYTDKEIYQHQMVGVRTVLRNHTTFHRMGRLLSIIGYEMEEIDNKKVAVVYKEKTKHILKNFKRQTLKNKDLISVNELEQNYSNYDYITFFNEKYEYGEYYLEDMVNGFKYTNSSYITKDSYFNGAHKISGIENNYINRVSDPARTIFSTTAFNYIQLMDALNSKELDNGYSIDSLELNLMEEPFSFHYNPKFSVIIAAYNNGDHLYSKCFMSLRRSSMFTEMEIIIVDDGSTDDYTVKIINRLARLYPNVKPFFYKDGGSGSASRPRNKGVELSSTDYVTFLDPDNEAINDGYAKLLQYMKEFEEDIVIGNIIKADDQIRNVNYFEDVRKKYGNRRSFVKEEVHEYLIETTFKVQSIQAMMFKKELLMDNNLTMLVGAVGEDTLFFYEALINAKSFSIIDEPIHVYYAGVEGSAVNNITAATFDKYKKLEMEKIKFLKKNNLLRAYMSLRFNYYFKNWYLKKLNKVVPTEEEKAANILKEIYLLYSDYMNEDDLDEEVLEFGKNGIGNSTITKFVTGEKHPELLT
ncbi:glycosyltransferase [Oceanobacillus salinisoli]|uniref:glycosyltransferase n=1 Tax=Oceanobacillus salinisoli TaxID=2678611 RepID=UPI0012E11C26|nr:glycosyltransferase [Oceanobacillus salinisoli]